MTTTFVVPETPAPAQVAGCAERIETHRFADWAVRVVSLNGSAVHSDEKRHIMPIRVI